MRGAAWAAVRREWIGTWALHSERPLCVESAVGQSVGRWVRGDGIEVERAGQGQAGSRGLLRGLGISFLREMGSSQGV